MTVDHSVHHAGCSCHARAVDRRSFLKFAAAGGATIAASSLSMPGIAAAKADVFLLSCMDYRLVTDVTKHMIAEGYDDNYDHVILAGASLAAVTPKFPDWNKTFWQHLDVAIKLHGISKVMVIDHRDCGAYTVVYGKDFAKDPAAETKIHTEVMRQLDKAIAKRHPTLSREYYLMALDTKVEKIAV